MTAELREIHQLLRQAVKPVMINEGEAAKLLEVKRNTLQTYVAKGDIPANFYTIGVKGKRFYDRDLLTGLKIAK